MCTKTICCQCLKAFYGLYFLLSLSFRSLSQVPTAPLAQKIKVYIVGGGVAGMSVAHELCKKKIRGQKIFDITILEKDPKYVGGKARSIRFKQGSLHFCGLGTN